MDCIIKIRSEVDDDPDLSYLGQHLPHNKANWSHVSKADLQKAFDNLPVEWQEREEEFDSIPELLDNYYQEQDKEKLRSYGDDWYMLGIWAEVEIVVNGVVQTIRSGGLYGIESESDKSYFREVAEEEIRSLKDILKKMGIKCRRFDVESPF